ncbi:hypothetical protein VE02_01226 [Pseudogymnoascus sp. 03VT05]|nr:hypothetical protein VE02_01226 [Pseudogymnoascus sp. 03VT05]
MTRFALEHPGGAEIIYRYAGHDATEEYSMVHTPSIIINELPTSEHIGVLDKSSVTSEWLSQSSGTAVSPFKASEKRPLNALLNLNDFEEVCTYSLTKKSYAFISGASNDNITRDSNKSWWERIWFRPQVLRNVESVNTRSQILGCDVEIPIFISPAGLAKTAGQEGELALSAGAASTGIIQCDRSKTQALIEAVTARGIKAIFITVDLPVVSKREADEIVASELSFVSSMSGSKTSGLVKSAGIARNVGSFINPTFSWEDIAWVRKHTHLPILLKGIQCVADAKKAMSIGCQGIILSNHGGRALDTAPPPLLTLLELLECPEIFSAVEVLIDGGIRRGSDVLKALCLGATGVGLGRSFMYAVNYGKEGVEHAVNILKDEIQTAMRLCGVTDLSQASPDMLNTAELDYIVRRGGSRHLYTHKVIRARL